MKKELRVMVLHRVLYNGQSQPGTPGGFGVALVHPIEPLKDPALVLRGDADAGIRYL